MSGDERQGEGPSDGRIFETAGIDRMTPVCRHPAVSAQPVGVPPRRSALTRARRPRRLLRFCLRSGPVASVIVAVLLVSGTPSPVGSEEGLRVPQHDPAVLAEIARDVINRASAGAGQPRSEPSSPIGVPNAVGATRRTSDPGPALSHPPGREGISVSSPATVSPPKQVPAVRVPTATGRTRGARGPRSPGARSPSRPASSRPRRGSTRR